LLEFLESAIHESVTQFGAVADAEDEDGAAAAARVTEDVIDELAADLARVELRLHLDSLEVEEVSPALERLERVILGWRMTSYTLSKSWLSASNTSSSDSSSFAAELHFTIAHSAFAIGRLGSSSISASASLARSSLSYQTM
jgi:hypothetical protein